MPSLPLPSSVCVSLSISVVVTPSLPLTLVSIAAAFVGRTTGPDPLTASRFELARTIAELMMYANHAINFYLYCATGQKFRHQLIWMVCYSRRTYWPPGGDAERRSPAPSAGGPGIGRLPCSETPSRYATGARLAMRAGDAVAIRRMAHSGNSGGSGASAGSAGASQQPGTSIPMTQRSQLNVVVVDAVCLPRSATLDNGEQHQSRRDITGAPCTNNTVL